MKFFILSLGRRRWGLAAHLSKPAVETLSSLLDIKSKELQTGWGAASEAEYLLKCFPQLRKSALPTSERGGVSIAKTDTFRVLDNGLGAVAVMDLLGGGGSTVCINEVFAKVFRPAEEVARWSPILGSLGSRIIVPEDHEDFLGATAELYFTRSTCASRLVQVRAGG
jgi:hypothetical protein